MIPRQKAPEQAWVAPAPRLHAAAPFFIFPPLEFRPDLIDWNLVPLSGYSYALLAACCLSYPPVNEFSVKKPQLLSI